MTIKIAVLQVKKIQFNTIWDYTMSLTYLFKEVNHD